MCRAEQAAEQQAAQQRDGGAGFGSEGEGREDDDHEGMLPPSKPFTRTMQKQEKEALQKWVQCARCNQWRKVGRLGLIVMSNASCMVAQLARKGWSCKWHRKLRCRCAWHDSGAIRCAGRRDS